MGAQRLLVGGSGGSALHLAHSNRDHARRRLIRPDPRRAVVDTWPAASTLETAPSSASAGDAGTPQQEPTATDRGDGSAGGLRPEPARSANGGFARGQAAVR